MRDAFGGLINIVIVVVFLVVITGYLAFNVNYTKAFRVKNKIITTIEQYEGKCDRNSSCDTIIQNYIKEIGYSVPTDDRMCIGGATCDCRNGYCISRINSNITFEGVDEDIYNKYYYKVVTATSIDVPMVNKIMAGTKVFQVSGTTKTFRD